MWRRARVWVVVVVLALVGVMYLAARKTATSLPCKRAWSQANAS